MLEVRTLLETIVKSLVCVPTVRFIHARSCRFPKQAFLGHLHYMTTRPDPDTLCVVASHRLHVAL